AIIDSLNMDSPKTKNITSLLKKLSLGKKVLIIVREFDENLIRASANIPDVMIVKADSVNTYQLLLSPKILFTKDAIDVFTKRLE
ncbi:MAG: 50S ribosomal protein L4, partial [Lentisphaerota bacterium]